MNTSSPLSGERRLMRGLLLRTLLCLVMAAPALALAAGALDKARETGKLSFGYRTDTRPFAYTDDAGKPAGFSVVLCQNVADSIKTDLKLPSLAIDFVPVTASDRFTALSQGKIDLLCGTSTPTMERRATFDFSIPIFYAQLGALVRTDTPRRLHDALADRPDVSQPVWRAAPAVLLSKVVFAVVGGTTVERSLIDALAQRRIEVSVVTVADYATGAQMVLDGKVAALFGDRPVLVEAAKSASSNGRLMLIQRNFGREPLSLAMRRGDDAFRLAIDRSLSHLYRSELFGTLFTRYFGAPESGALDFFRAIALPE
ncbi:amino acid ABC transporter substrate-binding protein [Variovorax sp. J22R133]|uniref:amino acid ABC transporter substrate-binding protein n=1 Tax=Variovorax brevis TaxID=3053503 RepID=UPI002577385F|nr:amino acid ABC transporter substrate-binding protein [Variovorax sp. J22R133]MDM0110854.1 amino acid ABC transporter substrate-binding protein [Variovorax sp. J22R133]